MENIDEGTSTYGVPNAFNVISGNKSLKLAARLVVGVVVVLVLCVDMYSPCIQLDLYYIK